MKEDSPWIEKIWQSIKSIKVSVKNISIFTVATFVVGAIPAYYAIIDHQEKEEFPSTSEILKDSIRENVDIILNSFEPEKISTELDSIEDHNIIIIRNFKFISMEYANYLKEEVNDIETMSIENKNFDEIEAIMDICYQKKEDIYMALDSLLDIVMELNDYGKKRHVNSYIVNDKLYEELIKLEDKVEKTRMDYVSKISDIEEMMSQKADIKGEKFYEGWKTDFSKILQLDDDFSNDLIHLRFLNKSLLFLINQNSNYNIPVSKHKLRYPKSHTITKNVPERKVYNHRSNSSKKNSRDSLKRPL